MRRLVEQWLKIAEAAIAKNPHRTVFNVAANDGTGSGLSSYTGPGSVRGITRILS